MRAEVTKEFVGQPDNHDFPRGIAVGEILYGALAEAAVAAGNAVAAEPSAEPGAGSMPKPTRRRAPKG